MIFDNCFDTMIITFYIQQENSLFYRGKLDMAHISKN